MRLIDADALDAEMYHKSFEVDDGRNVWNSGLWIRYKIFEEAIRDAPTVDAIPIEWMLNSWNPKEWEDVGYQVMRRIIADWAERKDNETD